MNNLTGDIVTKQTLEGALEIEVAVTPNITVGEVTTLPTGTNATVELDATSTKLNPKFNFGIPCGPKGDPGSIKFIIVNELPTENIDESAIYMKPVEEISEGNTYEEYIYVNGAWESLGSASVEVDLSNYVEFTDFATTSKAGVIKVSTPNGLKMNDGGVLDICAASNYAIDVRTPVENSLYATNINARHPIVPSNVDYAVKKALSDCKIEWTEEEKVSARELLGVATEVTLTQAEYDSLGTKDENTYYYIVEE